jgi:creatinine amidohydrolase
MLERISWWQARQLFQSSKVALVPVGSTEQHGPHLPLGTDFLTAQALAQTVARELNPICTPVIPIGVSEHHRQFWGTLWAWWLDPEVQKLTNELFRSRGTHAGAIETSIVLAIDPSLVDRTQIEAAARGASELFATTKDGAQLPLDTIDFSQSGATLDPREASHEAGQEIFQRARERLTALVRWLEQVSEDELRVKPHLP